MPPLIDRIRYARKLCAGRRVLDIGGQKMPNCQASSPFAIEYSRISRAAQTYRIVDCQNKPEVDYVLDLNRPTSLPDLRRILQDYRPEVILCMEILEHINCHFEVMELLAEAIDTMNTTVFITVPNNRNWIFNALGWNADHCVAFFREIAWRFVTRSSLGAHQVHMYACMQQYVWYWRIAYLLSFAQPFSWGFVIRKSPAAPDDLE